MLYDPSTLSCDLDRFTGSIFYRITDKVSQHLLNPNRVHHANN